MRELGSPCCFSGGFNPWLFRSLGWLLKLQLYDLNYEQLRGKDRSPESSFEVLYQPLKPQWPTLRFKAACVCRGERGFGQSCACLVEVLILKKKEREWILGDIWQIFPFGRKVIEWNLAGSQPCSIEIIKQVIWIRIVRIIINSDIYEIHLLPRSQASHWAGYWRRTCILMHTKWMRRM